MSESSSNAQNKANQAGAVAFQIFCACIFLGMIGLVFLNAVLRYCFNSGYPPSEEWARVLFILHHLLRRHRSLLPQKAHRRGNGR